LKEFLSLATNEILKIIEEKGKPKVGIFVAEGNRRMTMAFTGLSEDTDEFYFEYVRLFTTNFMKNLEVFFSHGLKTLIVPLISPTIIKRSVNYSQLALKNILIELFQNKKLIDFYKKNEIRVRMYGNSRELVENERIGKTQWIDNIEQLTSDCKKHNLYYGFSSKDDNGMELIKTAINFYKLYLREPTYKELVNMHYGNGVTDADFFIMSSKISGFGALPPLISNKKTEMYFFPAPGIFSLTKNNYRRILYDLLFCKPNKPIKKYGREYLQGIDFLKNYYYKNKNSILGIGKKINQFWVPQVNSHL
ncbi:MAG: hypothetical protein ACFFDN_27450, partial [Candidatus Hodarchaeota archaeon]